MPSVLATARKLLVAPILCAALIALALPAAAGARSDRAQCGADAVKAKVTSDDRGGRPAGRGGGRKVR